MSTVVSEVQTIDDELMFNLNDVDVSIVNGLRRVCLSNINTLVFRGFPHSENKINIEKNTTKFNNEYLKHRLQCVPIHNDDPRTFENYKRQYAVKLHAVNKTMNKIYITTQDFEIIEKESGNVLQNSKDLVSKMFPVDPISGEGILIMILMPHYNKAEKPDEINMVLEFDIGHAKQNNCWNVVSKSVFENVQDPVKVQKKLDEINESDPVKRRDFELLDAQREYIDNKYKFTIASLGGFSNSDIVKMACEYIIERFNRLDNELDSTTTIMEKTDIDDFTNDAFYSLYVHEDMEDFLVLKLKDDDYTIGKMIENHLYGMFRSDLEFVGFEKKHATEREAYIYIKYMNPSDKESLIKTQLKAVSQKVRQLFDIIYKSV
jgi:DNA-directed RNA polymerase subunit L